MNNFRLLQLVVFACTCLLLLKSAAFIFAESGSVITGSVALNAQEAADKKAAEAQKEVADDKKADSKAAADKKSETEKADVAQKDVAKEKGDKKVAETAGPQQLKPESIAETKFKPSTSELDLLESLAERRKQLNEREAALRLKENLLQAAERQIDERIGQLKTLEAKIQTKLKKQDALNDQQYRRLVKIYSSMKPKEAARIFNGLKMPILVDLMRSMKAAAGSQILAKMNAEKARELTLMLVAKDQLVASNETAKTDELPSVQDEKLAEKNQ